MYNKTPKDKAIELRSQGYSYNIISEKINVPKSTLYGWVANISYKPNKEVLERIGKARAASGQFKAKQKQDSLMRAKIQAKKDIGTISKRDLFMLGIGIYIGEGSKNGDLVRIINSDPRIIRLSTKWLIETCGLSINNFVIRLHVYPDNKISECIKYWSKETNIPIEQFQKTQIDTRQNKKISKRDKLPYGTAHITVRSNGNKDFGSFLGRRIRAWMEEILC